MKITIVCDVLGKENNGTTIAAMNLIRYLKEHGHEVRVLCCDQDRIGEEGFFVVPAMHFGPLDSYVEKNGVTIAKPDEDIVRSAIEGADIVHVMIPFALGRAAAKIAKELDIPLSCGCHLLAENVTTHIFMQNVPIANKIAYHEFGKLYKQADSMHYVTPYMRTLSEKLYGPTNGYVISNGVTDNFTPADEPLPCDGTINIVYTGRYSREKSHEVLFKAVAKSKYADRIQLILAGSGPLKDKLEKLGESLPVKPIMQFFPREKMPEMLRTCYLYVHAAEIEAEGISCLEAICCGVVPIINDSPRCATKSYAIEPNNMFRNNDPDDLAAKIDWWIEHRTEYIANRRTYIEESTDKFTRAKCMEQMERMLVDTATRVGKQKKDKDVTSAEDTAVNAD